MGKFDHIPELLGSENYIGWSTKMQYALACKDLWCHINMSLLIPTTVTAVETATMCEWLLKDMKAKDLVACHLSPSVGALVSRSHTVSARKVWQILAEHFNRTDTSAQYQL
ncbi:uncharacterized protein EDB93DRAFT_1044730, partial [Suillus bovinus]|uniref:uncharacterized protein n=1 Tax=Suillus bovinus TaxID=48563 RepID=UPI001B8696A0